MAGNLEFGTGKSIFATNKNTIMFKAFLLTISTLVLFLATATAQKEDNRANKGSLLAFHLSYAYELPGVDLKARFGNNSSLGLASEWMTDKGNWIMGLKFNYFFGNTVKQDVLAHLRTPEPASAIIGNDRSYADIQLRERGFYTGLVFGKLFLLPSIEKRSGIRVTISTGLLQHKIRIQDDPVKPVAQLNEDLKKGYDRLSNGLAFNEFIGYQILSNSNRINFIIGFEFTQGFTQNRRSFNYDTMVKETVKRIDIQSGIRVSWVLPLYIGRDASEIYY